MHATKILVDPVGRRLTDKASLFGAFSSGGQTTLWNPKMGGYLRGHIVALALESGPPSSGPCRHFLVTLSIDPAKARAYGLPSHRVEVYVQTLD